MTLARITALIAIATATTAAFGATPSDGTDTARGHTAWYQAGDRVLQGEEQRQMLERQGFPQYVD